MSTTSGRRWVVTSSSVSERNTRRLVDVVVRDFGKLVSLNLLLGAAILLPVAAYTSVLLGVVGGWAVVAALVGSVPVGGAVGAAMFCLTQLIQRQEVAVYDDFRRKFTENWRLLAVPGAVLGAFVFGQVHFWTMLFSGMEAGIWLVVALQLSLCVVLMIAPYVFLQAVYLDAGLTTLLRDAVVLASTRAGRSAVGMVGAVLLSALLLAFLPLSLILAPVVVVVGLSLTLLANLVFTWPVVDEQFHISNELAARRTKAAQGILPAPFLPE